MKLAGITSKTRLLGIIKKFPFKRILFWASLIIDLMVVPILVYTIIFSGKIYPNIFIAGKSVAWMEPQNAELLISGNATLPQKIKLTYEDLVFELPTKDIALSYDFAASSERAYAFTRTGNIFFDIYKRIDLLVNPKNFGLSTHFDKNKLEKFVSVVSGQVSIDPTKPSAKIEGGKVVVINGTPGTIVDNSLLVAQIGSVLANAIETEILVPTVEVDSRLTTSQMQEFQTRLDGIVGKVVEVKFDAEAGMFISFKYTDKEIVSLLEPKGGINGIKLTEIINGISSKIDRGPQNPKFSFEGGKVGEFLPAKDGIALDSEKLKSEIEKTIIELSSNDNKLLIIEAPVFRTAPSVTTDKINNLGIKELVGRGTSKFRGSIPSRVHNVVVASAKLNGILIPPGDIFSFNDALGDVSQFTGYQQAYVIKDGKTVLGDGGGVCQVSTTFFRSVLDAGLPVIERRAHAYRVGYYEQDGGPGIDATVYSPSPDLKIKNDTPNHILIQTTVDRKNYTLVFELYGTKDGRVSTVSKPVVSGVTAPAEDLYIDDPTLPAGVVKQTEHKAFGAKVSFNYKVVRGEETLIDTKFVSNYRPWQAVYLRGTGTPI